jgi:hypothetical protein
MMTAFMKVDPTSYYSLEYEWQEVFYEPTLCFQHFL